MSDLAELLLAYEGLERDVSERLRSGTPRTILIATVDAKLAGSSSLADIAAVAEIPTGTLKAARSGVPGLRQAMDETGQGPFDWNDLDRENAALSRFWRDRPPAQRNAWVDSYGCQTVHRLFDEHAPDTGLEFWESVPFRENFEDLWGDSAWQWAELLDLVTGWWMTHPGDASRGGGMNGPAGIVSGLDSQRLSARGIPQALTRGSQGSYLAAFLTDPRITVTAAAARAGLTAAAIRQRRSRDPVFAAAEKAMREGKAFVPDGEPQPVDDARPAGPVATELRERLHRSARICRERGPGPWPGTTNTRQLNTSAYQVHRENVIRLNDELARLGDPTREPVPEEMRPYPSTRGRRGDFGWR